jgi:hypothetical protein
MSFFCRAPSRMGRMSFFIHVLHHLEGVGGVLLRELHVQHAHTPGSGILFLLIHAFSDVTDFPVFFLQSALKLMVLLSGICPQLLEPVELGCNDIGGPAGLRR